MNDNNEIKYIAQRYRRGRFSADQGWKRLGIAPALKWRRLKMAAAISGIIVVTATAAVLYRQYTLPAETSVEQSVQIAVKPSEAVRTIDFENTPLPVVIDKIKETYGVEIGNIPENAGDYHLSLHYEGNAIDLVDTINEILEIQMTVSE